MPFELPPEGISIDGLERKFVVRAMDRTGWVTAKTAPLRGMSFKTLLYRLEKFGIFRH